MDVPISLPLLTLMDHAGAGRKISTHPSAVLHPLLEEPRDVVVGSPQGLVDANLTGPSRR